MNTLNSGYLKNLDKTVHTRSDYGDYDNLKVYVVAVPSADFSVKSVRVFKQKEAATLYMNLLYQTGEQPEIFETVVE